MRVAVIGGTGHVGTYLVPRLVESGHEVIVVSRQKRQPYQTHPAWGRVKQIPIDRKEAEAAGTFGRQVAALEPEAVVDMICFTLDSARQLVEALTGRVRHFLHCGTAWVHGHSTQVPTTEQLPRRPFCAYGIAKAAIEDYLLGQARRNGFPATVIHPGHIVGPGWTPINPAGNVNLGVFTALARGEEVLLPNLGMETLHHVHADDVAQMFTLALNSWSCAVGESFHASSPAAVTLRGYAEAVAGWFGREARLRFVPWEEFKTLVSPADAEATWDHIAHSPNCSIAKATRLLDYRPRYSSLQAIHESVDWLIASGRLPV